MNLAICSILALAALWPAPQIVGTITDSAGKPIAGISISVDAVNSNQSMSPRKTVSKSDGSFSFTGLPAGVYYGLKATLGSSCALSNAVPVDTGFTSVVRLRLVEGLCQGPIAL